MTHSKPGKLQELAEQIANTQSEIVAIQETRWNANGLLKRNDYPLHYCGSNKTGQAGIGFIYRHEERQSIVNEYVNEGSKVNITLINVYASVHKVRILVYRKKKAFFDFMHNSHSKSD